MVQLGQLLIVDEQKCKLVHTKAVLHTSNNTVTLLNTHFPA